MINWQKSSEFVARPSANEHPDAYKSLELDHKIWYTGLLAGAYFAYRKVNAEKRLSRRSASITLNKAMKTIITSNSRPLHRALCTLLLGIAALWAMPRSARAQLYVSQVFNGGVGKYNAATGAAINANFITGLSAFPVGLALSGNNLFVANAESGTVGEYNAITGAAIDAAFVTGLSQPQGLALSGRHSCRRRLQSEEVVVPDAKPRSGA